MFFHKKDNKKKDNKKKITEKKEKKGKFKKILSFDGKKKGKKGSYIDQLHLQPVYEDALCDALPQMLQDEDERYIKADPQYKIIYLLALTNDLIGQTDLKNNLGDLKTALNLSDSDGDVPGSIYNASFDIDLDPEPDPDGNIPTEDLEQIVFLPTMNTLDVLSTITDPNQKYEIVTLPADLNRDNLSDNYEQGAINPPLLDDNSNAPITKTLAQFEQFVDAQTGADNEQDDLPDEDGDYDDGNYDDGAGYDDTGNYDDTGDEGEDQTDYDDSTPDQASSDDLPSANDEPEPDETDDSDNDNDDFGLNFDDDEDNADDGINLDDAGDEEQNDMPFPDDNSSENDLNEASSDNTESSTDDTTASSDDDLSLTDNDSATESSDNDLSALNSLDDDDEGIDLDNTDDPDDEPTTVVDDQQKETKPAETKTNEKSAKSELNENDDLSALKALNNVDNNNDLNLDDAGNDEDQVTVVDDDLANNQNQTEKETSDQVQETSNTDSNSTSSKEQNLANSPADNDENQTFQPSANDSIESLNGDNLTNYEQPRPVQTPTYTVPTPTPRQSVSEQFDQLLKKVVPVNSVDYLKDLKLKLDDENEPFVYANHEDGVLYQLSLTEQDLREATIDEEAIGSLAFAISNGQKYGNIQGSVTTGCFATDLSNKHIIFMPNAYTLDVLQDVLQDAKFTVVTMPDDITVQNFDNYQALHQINIPINQMDATQLRLSIRGFKDYINKIKADNKRIENAKPQKSDKIIINVDDPTNLDEIGSSSEKPPIGAENEAAVKHIINAYMPRINELLDSIKTPAFGIDPKKDTDPEIVSSKQLYNDTLKADVEQVKSNIRAKIIDRITRSIRDVTDPNVFSENYPKVDHILHEKFLNKESIQKAIDEETSAINERYAVKRRNMIAKNIQTAKDDFQKTEIPKQNKEIENAKQKIRDLHNDAYLTAVNSVLAKQRDAHRDQISNDIDNIITQAQSDVSRGKNHISENTRTYLSELMRTIKTNRMIKQQLSNYVPQNPISAQPASNNNQKEMEEKMAGIRMASEASQREKDAIIEELRRQLAESKQQAIQAQAVAEKANADRTALENERNQYKSTVQILQNQSADAKPDESESTPKPQAQAEPNQSQSDPSIQAEIDELNHTSVAPLDDQTEQERQEERDTSDIEDQLQDSIDSLVSNNSSEPNPSDSSQGFSLDNY